MPLNSADLRHVINIQQKTQTQNATTGAITETWTTLHSNIRASIKPVSVRDFIQSRAEQSEISVRIQVPYIPGLDSTMRIVGVCDCHQGKIYNPAGWLEDDETGFDWLTAPCSQGVNEG